MAVVAVGDSIVIGGGQPCCGVTPASWAQRIADLLGEPIVNLAVHGATTGDVLAQQVPKVEGHYRLGLLHAGTNDCVHADVADTAANLGEIVGHLRGACDQVLVLTLPVSLGRTDRPPTFGPALTKRVEQVNAAIRQLGGVIVVEAPNLRTPLEVWADGIHPTSLGHARLAATVASVLDLPAPLVDPTDDRAFVRRRRRERARLLVGRLH